MRRQRRARALVPAPHGQGTRAARRVVLSPPRGKVSLSAAKSPSGRLSARRQLAADLRQRFGWAGPAPSESRPALVLLSGLPGTGKSHLAETLAARLPLVVLRSDEVRKALYETPRYTSGENGHVYLTCYALIDSLLRDRYGVIFDATNLIKRGRGEARRLATDAGAVFVLLVTTSPPDVVAERLRQRAAGQAASYSSDADWGVHEKLAGTMESISGKREPAILVDTSVSLQPAFDAVERILSAASPA